ncbi:MAG: tRNA lysidine(34) synthetase TilS [Rhodomicrobiaceae bacterium]
MELTHSKIDDLFSQLLGKSAIGLAVSGGGDSMALLHLFADWRSRYPLNDAKDVVLSVDHGVRAEAAEEVVKVIQTAEELGFTGVPIKLKGLDKGSSLQARAREARYEAMAQHLKEFDISHLLTAHTLDDQAETFLMRLLRGSGIDGLSSMHDTRELFGMQIIRPLLKVRGSVLRSWLETRGIGWVEDPSNRNVDYERVQVRQLLTSLDSLSLDREVRLPEMIGESVRRLQRGRLALENQALEFVRSNVTVHRVGLLFVKGEDYFSLPNEIQVRILRRLLMAFGIEGRSLSSLESGAAHITTMGQEKFVLAGVMCEKKSDGYLQFSREVGRTNFEIVEQQFGECSTLSSDGDISHSRQVIWDQRVGIKVPTQFSGVLLIRGFSNVEIAQIKDKYRELGTGLSRLNASKTVLPAIAGCWCEGRLVAVPQLEIYDESLFVELFGDLDEFLDGVSFERAVFPLKNWKTLLF